MKKEKENMTEEPLDDGINFGNWQSVLSRRDLNNMIRSLPEKMSSRDLCVLFGAILAAYDIKPSEVPMMLFDTMGLSEVFSDQIEEDKEEAKRNRTH